MKNMKLVSIDLESIGLFRNATHRDIFFGNVVYIVGDENHLQRLTIGRVMNPHDEFKAFECEEDGCRYGLSNDLYVSKTSDDNFLELLNLQNKIKQIKEII